MYGTVARLQVKPGMEQELREQVRAEAEKAEMPGYIHQFLYRLDAGPNIYYLVVIVRDQESYMANANSPEQHERYLKLLTVLDAEPEWHDGHILYPLSLTI